MTKMKRASFTLPPDLDQDLTYVSQRLGVSRSALVAEMLREGLSFLSNSLQQIPEQATETDVLRYRGESKKLVDSRLESARRMRDDLFSDMEGGDD